jgi:PAS domain S-box-containing protein
MKARLSLSFADRDKEERFLNQQRDNTAEHLRWACLVGAAVMIGFIWQDTLVSETGYKSIIIRICGALPVAALAWYSSRNLRLRRFISYISGFFWLSYACLTAAIFICYGSGPYGLTSSAGLGSFLIIIFGVFTFSNLRLWASILVGLSTLLVYTVSIVFWTEAVFVDFIMGDFLTIVALMIGTGLKTLFTEHAQRREFETDEMLHQSHAMVEQQVLERTAELRQSEKRFRNLFDSSRDAIMTLEPPSWKFTSGNSATLAMFGAKDVEHFVTLGSEDLSPELQSDGRASAEKMQEMIERAIREGAHFFEWTHQRINGQVFIANVLLSRIEEAGMMFLQASVRDITERKRAEEEIRRAKNEALTASKLKSTLLTNMSHEFRTPITGILGNAEILTDELTDSSLREFVEGIIISGNRLNVTLNSIMELAQLSSSDYPVRLQDLPFEQAIEGIVKDFEQLAKNRNLSLRLVNDCGRLQVLADREMFKKAVSQVVDNAQKFTKEGGVEIVLRSENMDGGRMAVCEVRDTGIGIATEDCEVIFQEFKQLSEGFSRSHEGSGIGLTIARKLIDLMCGSIKVKSQLGRGSTFSILLPASTSTVESDAQADLPVVKTRSSKPLILLVEDNYINANVVARNLRDICTLDHAKNGLTAIEMAREKTYDAILMDINLGTGINGVEVMTHLRKIPVYAGTPIAAVTGYTTVGEKEKFFDQGFSHYLPKPFEKNDVVQLVELMVGK